MSKFNPRTLVITNTPTILDCELNTSVERKRNRSCYGKWWYCGQFTTELL